MWTIISVGKPDRSVRGAIDRYLQRITRLTRCEHIVVPKAKHREPERVMEREADATLRALPRGEIIVCDQAGEQFTSEAFAAFLKQRQFDPLTVLIGGAFGLHQRVLDRADRALSLSTFTLQHDLALLLLMEQLYRALTINRGLPYHK